jgi:hypothetical protein
MTYLGTKFGALKKGFVQDHERPEVVLYRKQFVADFLKLMPRMFVYRRVNVHMAKQYLPAAKKESTAVRGNEIALVAAIHLEKVKDEQPSEKELKTVTQWAAQYCERSALGTFRNRGETVVVEADTLYIVVHRPLLFPTYLYLEQTSLCTNYTLYQALLGFEPQNGSYVRRLVRASPEPSLSKPH